MFYSVGQCIPDMVKALLALFNPTISMKIKRCRNLSLTRTLTFAVTSRFSPSIQTPLTHTTAARPTQHMAPAIMQSPMAPSLGWTKADSIPPKFDPSEHLVGGLPAKKMTMKDIGLPENIGVSPVAVSDPFQLFTTQAVEIMRKEIFNVPDQFKFQSNIAKRQLRGYAKQ